MEIGEHIRRAVEATDTSDLVPGGHPLSVSIGVAAAVAGDMGCYLAGRLMGQRLPLSWRSGPVWQRAADTFARQGAWAVLLTRFLLTPLALSFVLTGPVQADETQAMRQDPQNLQRQHHFPGESDFKPPGCKAPGDVVRNGWVLSLPRLRDMLSQQLQRH